MRWYSRHPSLCETPDCAVWDGTTRPYDTGHGLVPSRMHTWNATAVVTVDGVRAASTLSVVRHSNLRGQTLRTVAYLSHWHGPVSEAVWDELRAEWSPVPPARDPDSFYIATRLERHADHNLVRDALLGAGMRITYDWSTHGSVQRDGPERIRQVALAEKRGVLTAGFVVVLLPGGRGTHAELGMSVAAGIPTYVHSEGGDLFGDDGRTCAFYHDPCVRHGTCPLADVPADVLSWMEGIRADVS